MIHLIGVDHIYQTGKMPHGEPLHPELLNSFKEAVAALAIGGIEMIGEEFSQAALNNNNIQCTTVQKLATQYNVLHLFIDPDLEERKSLGIVPETRDGMAECLGFKPDREGRYIPDQEAEVNKKCAPLDAIREREWLRRIKPYANQDLLVICGFQHIKTFSTLLENAGLQIKFHAAFTKTNENL